VAVGEKCGYEPAFGTQGEAEGGIFHVAAGDDVTVVTQAGGPDPQA
jgi:hypothetical protein